ncbi:MULTISPECIES: ABC transporter permease [Burkholderia]|uniref:ABC transporter permease n=1 Tax=Burkholderia TaxID=32008 RepID=UPI00076D6920|nr:MULTISPECIES: ABC transporter permease [Burkholderia]KVG43691.1 sugar ABC transporter permease [Burkholderia sp. MSMB0265]KVG93026.1 sugar ABC transporter permease [Burkholderia sp. MSMB2042]KVH02163.1 sugar ABC transporter permease [Burkholderia sp. MSMB2041]
MNNGRERERQSIRSALRIQLRVIGALLMREIITRYGRHNIGFLWLLLEPIIFTVGVVILWNITHSMHGFRVPVTPFVVTGYSSLLLWRTCSFRGLKAIEPNRSLLHHRPVKIQDIFFARMLLEVAGVTASLVLLIVVMIGIDLMSFPADLSLIVIGWFFLCWFSACLGIILGCLSEHSDLVERLWHPGSYFLLAVSGTFFMVDWLPQTFQNVVLWFPMTNAVEMMRAGYWGNSNRFHFSVSYTFLFCLSMTLVALLLMGDRRMKMLT